MKLVPLRTKMLAEKSLTNKILANYDCSLDLLLNNVSFKPYVVIYFIVLQYLLDGHLGNVNK